MQSYLQAGEAAAPFYPRSFSDPDAYRDKAREVQGRFGNQARKRAASLMVPSDSRWASRLEEWVRGEGFLVTTGQQPGLFGGPLYSLFKALTAIRLARTLEDLLNRPVLPLFWIASEDHDWEEADHAHLLDVQNELRTFRLPEPEGPPHRPLFRIPLGPGARETVDGFLQALPESDFSESYFKLIRDAFAPGATLPDGFGMILRELLEDFPIFFVDAADPGLKEVSLPIFLRELEEAAEHEQSLADNAAALEEAGFSVQVPILRKAVNLFLEGPEGRDRLYRDGDGFRLHRAGSRLSAEEIRSRLDDDPSRLSPNVLLRPVVESAVFPTVSYVAGPGEMAYFAQLSAFFQAFDMDMPVVHPRRSALLLEAKIEKVLDKFELSPESLDRPHHEVAARVVQDEIPPEVKRAMGELRGAIGQGAGALGKAVRRVDPTLKGPVDQARNAAFSALDDVEKKIRQALKRENEIALDQLEKARRHLFPLGKPQERILNPFYYLTRYGPELIPATLEQFHMALGTDSA